MGNKDTDPALKGATTEVISPRERLQEILLEYGKVLAVTGDVRGAHLGRDSQDTRFNADINRIDVAILAELLSHGDLDDAEIPLSGNLQNHVAITPSYFGFFVDEIGVEIDGGEIEGEYLKYRPTKFGNLWLRTKTLPDKKPIDWSYGPYNTYHWDLVGKNLLPQAEGRQKVAR